MCACERFHFSVCCLEYCFEHIPLPFVYWLGWCRVLEHSKAGTLCCVIWIGLMWFLFLFFSILANTICLCVTVKEADIAVENWDPKLEQEKNRTLFSKRTYSPNASKSYSVIFTWHTTRFIFANIKTAQFLVIPAFRPSGNLCASLKDGDRLC